MKCQIPCDMCPWCEGVDKDDCTNPLIIGEVGGDDHASKFEARP